VQIIGIFWPKKLKKIAAIVFFSLFYFFHKTLPECPSKGPDCLALNIEGRRYTPSIFSKKIPHKANLNADINSNINRLGYIAV